MARRGPARCRNCDAHVVFFRSPFTKKPRTFDPAPVTSTHPLAGVKAFPILGGVEAYKPGDLVDVLMVLRQCSEVEAKAEVDDVPWHLIHECADDKATDVELAPASDLDADTALLLKAAELTVTTQFGSVSQIQRTLHVTYPVANRLMGRLEETGVVGPVRAAQSREVLVRPDQLDEVRHAIRGEGPR